GAAGGTAYGFAAAWGAAIEPGARYISALSGLSEALKGADVVLTGEGRFDATSSTGKVVGELLGLARRHGTPVGVVAGQVAVDTETWAVALADLAGSPERAMSNPIPALEEAGREAARHFARTAR
ncbi:MAG TPA: glycerate kinase, partial [Terrimesophilobacter sp.]|uniref:glycerate kinase n=1 Tax=Terrimesophilobacter sp. TaxID=2906435 RepID=UPI002F951740